MNMVRTLTGTVFALFVVVVVMSSANGATYGGGTGTTADPYLISTRDDLFLLAESPDDLDKSFRMTNDIDMEGSTKSYRLIGGDQWRRWENFIVSSRFPYHLNRTPQKCAQKI